jgi:hypothetical protein
MFVRRVVGSSMQPTYGPGAIVLGLRWRRPKVGDVVMADLHGREIVKRVSDVGPLGYYLLGDNAVHSSDSRKHGWFTSRDIKGIIIGGIRK